MMKYMYDELVTHQRIMRDMTETFPIATCLHQESTLSHYLFALIMNEPTRHTERSIMVHIV